MSKKVGLAALMAAVLVSGCASTRGGQNIACDTFDDYALEPKPHAIVRDIQRYGVENRGTEPEAQTIKAARTSEASVEALMDEAIFGMDQDALEKEAQRLRKEYDRSKSTPQVTGVTGVSGLTGAGQPFSEDTILVRSTLEPHNVLLLSGGGQWGAYGAGLFLGMICKQKVSAAYQEGLTPCLIDTPKKKRVITDDDKAIDFAAIDKMDIGVITGVSTGSLQSLLLMVVLDKTQKKSTRIAALQQMLDSYAPEKQSDLVDYDGYPAVIFQGSVAGTDALRDHVGRVLEKKWGFRDGVLGADGKYTGEQDWDRRLVDQLAYSPITTLVGVVQGRDGDFKSVNMRRMVGDIQPEDAQGRRPQTAKATNCVLATTLASSAMPAFHQQLRVVQDESLGDDEKNGVTLFDGGVRRSVFISEFGDAFKRRYAILATSMGKELYSMADKKGKIPKMYVLRNGPTTSVWNHKVNKVDNAIEQALRAYELLVNELEVSSIATLRLANPYGPMMLSTADGSENKEFLVGDTPGQDVPGPRRPGCDKNGEMFDPEFMVCLQNFGIRRGMELEVDKNGDTIPKFWPISEIEAKNKVKTGPAANDNEPD